jgi:hypothetical protein
MSHVAAPELPYVKRWELWDTRACASVLSFVLTSSLYAGVSGLQGTDGGPRAHPGRGCELTGGASILSCATFLCFVHWDFEAVVQHGRYVAPSAGTLRAVRARSTVPNGLPLTGEDK